MIDVTCPQCHAVYHSEETHVGKHLRCTHCGSLVSITDNGAERIVSVEAQQVHVNIPSGVKVSTNKAKNPHSRRWPLYGGVFVVLLAAVSMSMFWYAKRDGETKPIQNSTQPSPSTAADASNQKDIFDEVVPDEKTSTALNGRESGLRLEDNVPASDRKPVRCDSLPTNTRMQEDTGTDGHGELTGEHGTDRKS